MEVIYNFDRRGRREPRVAARLVAYGHPVPRPGFGTAALPTACSSASPGARRDLGPGCPVGAARDREGEASAAQRHACGTTERERALFALVANRALAVPPKLASARWVNEDALVAGLP